MNSQEENSKSERISFRAENGVRELINLFSEKTGLNKSDVVREFFLLGVNDGIMEYISDEAEHWDFGFSQVKKITSNHRFNENISRIIQKNKVERRTA